MGKTALLAIIVFISACNNGENVDGGPCTYDDKILPARLTRFDKIDSLRYDAVFVIEDTSSMEWRDSLRYSKFNHSYYLSAGQIAGDSLVVGKKYQYITRSIRTGHCNPHIELLVMKPYNL